MRDTEPPPPPWRPLGPAVPRETSKPAPPAPAPSGEYGVIAGPDGKFKTTKHPGK